MGAVADGKTGGETGAGVGAGASAGAAIGATTGAETGAGIGAETEAETGAETGAEFGSAAGTEAGAGAGMTGAAAGVTGAVTASTTSGGGAGWAGAAGGGDFFLKKRLNMGNKYIRIVGGQYRRTPIVVPDVETLRPTPDRVRETLFNWLNHLWAGEFADKQVLDLFAGSGALGFEAASRGVAHVQMVERDKTAASALRTLRDKLKADMIRIHVGDAMQVAERMDASRFDLILLDPPFGQGWLPRLWPILPGILNEHGLVYVEAETPIEAPEGFQILRQDKAGAVHYHLLEFAALRK
jgi:16S rRNA (guanine(966)-N(2))-methyltransferase RsmD